MKKCLAVLLAIAMMVGMASVSFAAQRPGSTRQGFDVYGPLLYDEDDDWMFEPMAYPGGSIEYGDTVYFALGEMQRGAYVQKKYVEKLKVKFEAEAGGELVEETKVVKVRNRGQFITSQDGDYQYFIAMKIADKKVSYESDIIGEFEINRKAVKEDGVLLSPEIKDYKFKVNFSVFYDWTWINTNIVIEGGDTYEIWPEEKHALKFDGDEEATLTFGSAPNEGEFEADISGQGKVYIEMNTDPDEAITAANPNANIFFVNFVGINDGPVKFNRAGEFTYEMEDGAYAYYIVDGVINEIPDAYDEAEEAFVFTTNKLGYYAFSNMALVNPAA